MTPTTINSFGLQANLARKLRVNKATISRIFNGKVRATAQQARALEQEFIRLGIPLTHWDLLFEVKDGQSLSDYLKHRNGKES